MKKRIAILLTAILLITLIPIYAFAENIFVWINKFDIVVNGVKIETKGNYYVRPGRTEVPFSILYAGTTYLPVRKLADIYNKRVAFYRSTGEIVITTKSDEEPIISGNPLPEFISATNEFNVEFNCFNIVFDGKKVVSKGQNYNIEGAEVPFSIVYDGTTYLPIRKLGEIFGKKVGFKNDVIYVGESDIIKEYIELPGFLDYGAFTETKAAYSSPLTEDAFTVYAIYEYDDCSKADIDKYRQNLIENGCIFCGGIEYEKFANVADEYEYYNPQTDTYLILESFDDKVQIKCYKNKTTVEKYYDQFPTVPDYGSLAKIAPDAQGPKSAVDMYNYSYTYNDRNYLEAYAFARFLFREGFEFIYDDYCRDIGEIYNYYSYYVLKKDNIIVISAMTYNGGPVGERSLDIICIDTQRPALD